MINRFSHAAVTAASAALMLLATGTVYAAQASTGPAAGRAASARPGCAVDKAARGTLYVANFYPMPVATVTPIPVCTNVAGKPIPVGNGPVTIAITPNGKTAYVVNENSGTVTPIRTATNTPGKAIRVAGRLPDAIAITPNGKTAYVASSGSSGVVTPIRTATNTPGRPIPVGQGPIAIAITPNGTTAYVVSFGGVVTPIHTATNSAGPTSLSAAEPSPSPSRRTGGPPTSPARARTRSRRSTPAPTRPVSPSPWDRRR